MRTIFATSMAGVCLLAIAAPASAQTAASQDPATTTEASQNEEIVVQARRRDESIQDVPAVVNAVTGDEIANLGLRDFTEVKDLVPGLQLSNNANGIGGNAQMRGVNFDVNASGFNATVEFYQNDAPLTAGVVLQQMYDVGQIEVVRGPQGTLRGRASPSGSIIVTTKKPDLYDFGGYIDLTANNIGTMNAQGALNVPVIKGIAAIRVAGVIDQGEGNRIHSIDRTADARDPYTDARSFRVSALIEPADWLRLEGNYQRIDRFSRQFGQVESFRNVNPAAIATPVLIGPKDRLSNVARPTYLTQLFDIYNGRGEVSFGGQQLIYQFSHYTQNIDSFGNQDPANFFPATTVVQRTQSNIKSTSHELRLQNQERVFGMFDYVIGGFDYVNETPTTLNSPTVIRLPVALGGGVATVNQTAIRRTGKSHERSFFGNVTAHIGESTEVSGGLRFISYKDDGQLYINGALAASNAQDDDQVIYTASIKHSFSPDFMIYANTGTSYRPGISAVGDFNIARSARENSFLNLAAETSQSYEVGLKSSLFNRRVRFNLSGYYQKFTNFPYRSPNGVYYVNTVAVRNAQGQVTGTAQQVGVFNFVGAVPVEVKGVEVELSGNITPRWSLGVVASYSDGKIKNGIIPCNDLNSDGKPDTSTTAPTLAALQAAVGANNLSQCSVTQRSAFQSPFSASVQTEYSLPITNHVDGYLRGLFNLNGSSQGDPTSAFDDVGSYGLLNLFVGIRAPDGQWELTAYAKNITDEVRVLTRGNPLSTSYQQLGFGGFGPGGPILTGPTGTSADTGYVGITTTPLREFGLSFKFRFGSR